MRTNKNLWLCCLFVLLVVAPASAQVIAPQYELIQQEFEEESEPEVKKLLRVVLDLTYVFYVEEMTSVYAVPHHIFVADPDFYSNPNNALEWRDTCEGIVRNIYHDMQEDTGAVVVVVDTRLYESDASLWPGFIDFAKGKRVENITAEKLGESSPVVHDLIRSLVNGYDKEASSKVKVLMENVSSNKSFYDRKYAKGFRSRNILQYYADSSFHHFIDKEKKGLLSPPSDNEMILLSKPVFVVGTNSFNYEELKDENNFYLMVQAIGWDFFGSDFKSYWGFSVFATAAFNNDLFNNGFVGFEGHYSSGVMLGFGVQPNGSGKWDNKIFLSIPWISENWLGH